MGSLEDKVIMSFPFTSEEKQRFLSIDEIYNMKNITCLINKYSSMGRVDIIQWLKEIGCCWRFGTMTAAAREGQLETVIWLVQQGCRIYRYPLASATIRGHLAIVKYLRSIGCSWQPDTFSLALSNRHYELVQWLRDNGCPE